MSILKDVLNDEYSRLQSLSQWYSKEIALLPKGSISIKKRKNRDYLYINYRLKERVKSDYIGYVASEKAIGVIKKIKQRKEYERELKAVKSSLKELERVLHGKKI